MRWLAAGLLLAGCRGADVEGRWGGSVDTLPNGAVRVTNPAEGLWQRGGTTWRLVPELAIGAVDGPEAFVFAAAIGLEVDGAGRIYVLDRQANELRIFSADGTHVRSVGRSGSGPGEYANANGLRWISPDTLVVVDQRGNRYSILTGEGAYVRSVPRRLGFYGWAFSGGYENGRLYERSTIRTQEEQRLPVLLGPALGGKDVEQRAGLPGVSEEIARSSEPGIDTVYLPVPTGPLHAPFTVQTERGGMMMAVPFAPGPVYHVDGRGGIWHGHGSEPRIVRSSFDGDTIMEILLDAEATPVDPAELSAWEAGQSVRQFREMGGRLDLSRIPKVKPFFDDLYLDPDGHLWVSVPAPPMEVVFAVLDREGRYLGRLQVSGLNRDTFVPPVVRNRRLYVVGRDELDVQRVHVFRIEG